MRFKNLYIICAMLTFATTVCTHYSAYGQWSAPYANSWIKYGKPYVKIGIAKKGLHKISFSSLPKDFPTNAPEKLQLWRRGKEVSIISTTNNEIVFYAVLNDGASDSLLYRPMNSRLNPYFSMYSDEGSYFLTVGDAAGQRAKTVNVAVDNKTALTATHKELQTAVFKDEYSLSTQTSIRASFFNSFFEEGASRTGKVVLANVLLNNNFTLKDFSGQLENATVKLLVHGRSNNDRKIEVYVGKNAQSLRLVNAVSNSGFTGSEYTFNLKTGDVDANNKGILALKTVGTDKFDRFSLAYYSISYDQLLTMDGLKTKEFNLAAGSQTVSRLQIKDIPTGSRFLNVTDKENPIVIQGVAGNLMLPRVAGKVSNLFVSSEMTEIAAAKIKSVSFGSFNPKEHNYIIITSENLLEGATKYAGYRTTSSGGGFKPLVANISDIYNQFNYGEPSPVAIKKFMAYMLGEGGKDKYLFLIGKSITHVERMKRELPDEVPTIGYPASDMLLVEGLAGAKQDEQAIPVGRLSAVNNQNVYDYLQKVRDYERNAIGDYGWRKNVLHLNGGKNVSEISQLKGLLNDLVPSVVNGPVGGKVTPFVKQQAMAEVESVNITPDVNNGVGLITYFGHGSPTVTDLDMGYITDVARGYDNALKYPMMYFNGCGVGNIFSGRFNLNPNATDRITLSLDWLLAPNRGTVAIIANSFESFVSPSSKYLQQLYKNMFVDPATINLSIGKIQTMVANQLVTSEKDKFSIANVHQSLLQGDPALKLISVNKPDYSLDPDQSLTLYSGSAGKTIGASDSIRVAVTMANEGRFIAGESIPLKVTIFGSGNNVIKTLTVKSFPNKDTISIAFANTRDIKRIEAHIDPEHKLNELNISNNTAELAVDWDFVKDKSQYSSENIKDVLPPLLKVFIDDRLIQQDDIVGSDPRITLEIQDDRQLQMSSSLAEVFIKKCADDLCDFEKLVSTNIVLDSIDTRSFRISYSTENLGAGTYELLVNVKDRAGNATVSPYQIRFIIAGDDEQKSELVVSPNPGSSFFRFETKTGKAQNLKSIQYLIYSQSGLLLENKTVNVEKWALTNDWYWTPAYTPSGLYIYKVKMLDNDGNVVGDFKGKIALIR